MEHTDSARRNYAAGIVKRALFDASPKKTGRLSRAWVVRWQRNGIMRLRNKRVYARYQDTRTRNRGYIRRGLNLALPLIQQAVQLPHERTSRVRGARPGTLAVARRLALRR